MGLPYESNGGSWNLSRAIIRPRSGERLEQNQSQRAREENGEEPEERNSSRYNRGCYDGGEILGDRSRNSHFPLWPSAIDSVDVE